jgi:hypothetical protein
VPIVMMYLKLRLIQTLTGLLPLLLKIGNC